MCRYTYFLCTVYTACILGIKHFAERDEIFQTSKVDLTVLDAIDVKMLTKNLSPV